MNNFIRNLRTARRPSLNIFLSLSLFRCCCCCWQRHAPAASWVWRWCNWHRLEACIKVRQSGDPSAFFHLFIFHENINEIQHKINKAIINWRILTSCSCWCHPGPVHTQSDTHIPPCHIPDKAQPQPQCQPQNWRFHLWSESVCWLWFIARASFPIWSYFSKNNWAILIERTYGRYTQYIQVQYIHIHISYHMQG